MTHEIDELLDTFQRQLNHAKGYADEENPTGIPTVFQLQIGHLRDMWPELRDHVQALQRERDEARNLLQSTRINLAAVGKLNRQLRADILQATSFSNIFCAPAIARAEAAEAKVKVLTEAAHRMVSWIEGGHIPYLIDTDDNPGQALRQALKENQHD